MKNNANAIVHQKFAVKTFKINGGWCSIVICEKANAYVPCRGTWKKKESARRCAWFFARKIYNNKRICKILFGD